MIKSPIQPKDIYHKVVSLVGQIGCITIIIILAAGFLGRWLDGQFQTGRNFTLWLILLSFPVTLIIMYLIVRVTIRGIEGENDSKNIGNDHANDSNKEDVDNGTSS